MGAEEGELHLRRRFDRLLLWIALVSAGCGATTEESRPNDADGLPGSFGVLELERPSREDDPYLSGSRAVLGAVFARYRGLDRAQVLDLLGVERPKPPVEGCALVGTPETVFPHSGAAVELLDVGTVEVELGGSSERLYARTFPELGTLVSGVFYAEDTELPTAHADRDTYRIRAEGSAEMAGFEIVLAAPPAPVDVQIGDRAVGEGPLEIARTGSVSLGWAPGQAGDRVEIQLAAGAHVIECVARDDGSFAIPFELLAHLDADEDARLVLRRVATQAFDVPDVESAWAEVKATRTVPVTVR